MLAAAASLFLAAAAAAADPWPARPLRFIVPFAPGGASDVVARVVAANCRDVLPQPCVVENISGASGNAGMEAAARAAPDGHTVFLGNVGTTAVNPHLYRNLTIDPLRAFAPVTQLASQPGMMVAHPAIGTSNLGEFVERARREPGKLNYGSPGAGSSFRILMELFKKQAGLDIVEVPYKGGAGPAVTGLLAGDTQVAIVTVGSVDALVRSGKLAALAVTTDRRITAYPAVPTFAESGFPGIVDRQWQGLFLPRDAPRAAVTGLHAAAVRIMQDEEVRRRLSALGAQAETSASPAEFAAYVAAQSRYWAAVIAEAGIRAE